MSKYELKTSFMWFNDDVDPKDLEQKRYVFFDKELSKFVKYALLSMKEYMWCFHWMLPSSDFNDYSDRVKELNNIIVTISELCMEIIERSERWVVVGYSAAKLLLGSLRTFKGSLAGFCDGDTYEKLNNIDMEDMFDSDYWSCDTDEDDLPNNIRMYDENDSVVDLSKMNDAWVYDERFGKDFQSRMSYFLEISRKAKELSKKCAGKSMEF